MVEILLATYNGEKYLNEQLDSIFNQTYQNFKIIVCDDKSSDKTEEIIYKYKNKYPNKIEIINSKENRGHCYNFLNLLKYSHSDYVMFCDQDDIWFPEKVEVSLREMKKYEKKYEEKALLLHTDQIIINELKQIINISSTEYFKKIINFKSLEEIGFRGGLHGCTMLLNKELLNQLKIKQIWNIDGLIYHDWSIAIIAKMLGDVIYLEKSTMYYRIHNNNASLKNDKIGIINLIKNTKKRRIEKCKIFNQYYSLLKEFNDEIDLININDLNYFKRLIVNFKMGVWKYEKNILKKIIKIFEI